MKYLKILLLIIPFFITSCEEWLDVTPSDQISESELFSTSEGYRNALLGIYRNMSTKNLYAQELTWGFNDVRAQYYDINKSYNYTYRNLIYQDEYDYEYDYVNSLIDNIWKDSYNIIANCNNLIAVTTDADTLLFNDGKGRPERDLILGEAYAVRAFLHFDLLRLFGESPKVNPNSKLVSYVDKFPSVVNPPISTTSFLDKVIADLEKAEELTSAWDVRYNYFIRYLNYYLENQRYGGYSDFILFRGYRLNHFAIKALLARVYMYKGNLQKAAEYAKSVIDTKYFKFSSSYYIGNGRTKLYDDVLFSLYNEKLVDYYSYECQTETTNKLLALKVVDDIFVPSVEKDYRFTKCIDLHQNSNYISKKYFDYGGRYDKYNKNIIPVIRLSEMYLILAEALYDTDKTAAINALKTLRTKRASKDEIDDTSKETFMEEIKVEYQREFIGEGQLFYFYKRLNKNIISGGGEIDMTKNFVLPIPKSETNVLK